MRPPALLAPAPSPTLRENQFFVRDYTLQSSLLFQVICQRYQKQQPIALTSNKAFSEWGQVFAEDAVLASAALDRLLHCSTVINIRGESYRRKEKRQAGPVTMTDNQKGDAT